jgi:hypothetical protein
LDHRNSDPNTYFVACTIPLPASSSTPTIAATTSTVISGIKRKDYNIDLNRIDLDHLYCTKSYLVGEENLFTKISSFSEFFT